MAPKIKNPLRTLTEEEKRRLSKIGRSQALPAEQVIRAKILLGVAAGLDHAQAARSVGRKSNDAVSHLVSRFNREGLAALESKHSGGPSLQYRERERARILEEFHRQPQRLEDGTATWSLVTLQRALRQAPDGLPHVSTYVIREVLHEAGLNWQADRSWCQTGQVWRKRKRGVVKVIDPDWEAKKKSDRTRLPSEKAKSIY